MKYRKKHFWVIPCLLLTGMLGFVPYSTSSHGTAWAGDTQAIIERFEDTHPSERGRLAAEIAEEGETVIPALTEIIEGYYEIEDAHVVVGCLIALRQFGPEARNASEPLLNALEAPTREIKYLVARTLGDIWAGEGREGDNLTRRINTKLLSYALLADGAEKYGPALALTTINEIPVRDSPNQEPESLDPRELTGQIYNWFEGDQELLLPIENWPWPLLMQTYLRDPESDDGVSAKALLIETAPLEAVDFLLQRLVATEAETTAWEAMADLLGQITDFRFPVSEARDSDDVEQFLLQWEREWFEEVKNRRDQTHRNYAWQSFEQAIRAAKFEAYPEDFEKMELIREVIIHLYDHPDQIPQEATRISRKLIREQLYLKKQLSETLDEFREQKDDPDARIGTLQRIRDKLQTEKGRDTAMLFIEQFRDIAQEEEHSRVLSELSGLLADLSGIPVTLPEASQERDERLQEWMENLQ